MNVKKLKSGKYEVRIEAYVNGKRRQTRRRFKTRKEAIAFQESFIADKINGKVEILDRQCSMTLAKLNESFNEYYKAVFKESSYLTSKSKVNHHVLPYLGSKKINQITTSDIVKWHAQLLSSGLSIGYARNVHERLSAVLNYGVELGLLTHNVCKEVGNIKKSSVTIRPMNYLDYDEWLLVEEKLPDNIYGLTIRFLYWSGLRIGEVLALTYSDFSDDFSEVHVTKTLSRKAVDGGYNITPPKTKNAVRYVTLEGGGIAKRLRELYDLKKGAEGFNKKLFVFGDIKPVGTTQLKRVLDSAIKAAGIEKHIRIHDLRHSHASLLIADGVDPAILSARLGHADISTTFDVYVHFFEQRRQRMVHILSKYER